MIYPAKYNGINFSSDFTRESPIYNFDNQRKLNIINSSIDVKYLSFFVEVEATADPTLNVYTKNGLVLSLNPISSTDIQTGFIYFFIFNAESLPSIEFYMELIIDGEKIYSEFCIGKETNYLTENEICHITASNNDDRHGYLANQAFGFFKFSKFKSDIFLKKTVNYEYSYGRKKVLSSENQIAKRFTFKDLSMYQQNLLKWLCNCENLSIDGVDYELISEFTEIESDPNSEIMSLQADFVEVNQSFFSEGSINLAKNVFQSEFFMK